MGRPERVVFYERSPQICANCQHLVRKMEVLSCQVLNPGQVSEVEEEFSCHKYERFRKNFQNLKQLPHIENILH